MKKPADMTRAELERAYVRLRDKLATVVAVCIASARLTDDKQLEDLLVQAAIDVGAAEVH